MYYPVGVATGISGNAGTGLPMTNGYAPAPMAQPTVPNDGTFPYDGGPKNPIPLPMADPQSIPATNFVTTPTATPISGKTASGIAPATTPYKYKAYGEK
jgi:hypothetical protein